MSTSTVNPRSGSDNVIRFSSVHPMLHLHWHGRWAQARALDRFAQKSSGLRRRVDPLRDDPSTLLLRRASRRWLFDDPYGSRARTVFISDSSAGRIESAELPLGASSDSASVWLPDFATRNATLP